MAMALTLAGIGLVLLVMLPIDLVRRGAPLILLRGDVGGDIEIKSTRIRHGLLVAQLTAVTSIVYWPACCRSVSVVRRLPISASRVMGCSPSGCHGRKARPAADPTRVRFSIGSGRWCETLHKAGVARHRSSRRRKQRVAPGTRRIDDAELLRESDPAKRPLSGGYQSIMAGYPGVLGTALTQGAEPSAAELDQLKMPPAEQIGLANRALARQLEQFGPVLGQVVAIGGSRRYRIVGVLPDIVLERLDRPVRPTIFGYLPPPATTNVVLVRLGPRVEPEAAGVVGVLANVCGPRSPRPMAMDRAIALATTEIKSRAYLLTAVAIVSIPLALLGVAGALSFATRQQTHAIAVTLAIGATPGGVRWRILRQSLGLALVAVGAGLAIGVAGGRVLSGLLYQVGAVNLGALVVSGSVVLLLVTLSAAVPARRAGSINPATVLRGA